LGRDVQRRGVGAALVLVFVLAASAASKSAAANLFVSPMGADANDGTKDAPFRSISAAAQRATPGTTVIVAPGDYDGGFVTKADGTAASMIRYVSQVKWGARLRPPRASTSDTGWDNRGAYVLIDGFEIDGSDGAGGSPWRFGLYSAGAHSVVANNHVHNIANSFACSGRGGSGIEGDSYYGGAAIDIVANIVHDVGPKTCSFVQGIYQTAPGSVANNLVYRVSGWGIHLWHDAHDVLIVDNTVFNSAAGGILVGGGDYVRTRGPADFITVANNIVFDNAGYGIVEAGDTGSHNVFTHNLSAGNRVDWRLLTSAPDPAAQSSDPKFVRYAPSGGGDYHLAPGSPAIGAGTCDLEHGADLDGVTRRQGIGCDMGAYAFRRE
jgi:hypothetical protein